MFWGTIIQNLNTNPLIEVLNKAGPAMALPFLCNPNF
jgi:hypothetical protein